ncbi:hypothetical protein SAMN05414139_06592 [Burkholderia sp. D7]|nr:hypothetical protein SAMN05414139_06592 [Burkholderia sp. D7]
MYLCIRLLSIEAGGIRVDPAEQGYTAVASIIQWMNH